MSRAFSAPGKALLVGGYLVLDPKYEAYTIALSARIHTLVESQSAPAGKLSIVKCSSPQFQDSTWIYEFDSEGQFSSSRPDCENPFLRAAVYVASTYARSKTPLNITLTVFSDDAFHTQQGSRLQGDSSDSRKSFHFHDAPITKVPKTGLGSSAALTVSVMTALLSQLDPEHFSLDPSTDYYKIIHNLSQIAHCYSQGKIGSGFDIATAIWGSIVYSRFPASQLNRVCELAGESQYFNEFSKELQNVVDSLNVLHDKNPLPPNLSLLMGDVNGGSETPKLVSRVLQWKKDNPKRSTEVWDLLYQQNMALVKQLVDIREHQNSDATHHEALGKTIRGIRSYLRLMSKEANVPIEPPSQTILLDKCESVPGVIGGVVPGAGGYDAICLVVETKEISQIKQLCQQDKVLSSVSWLDLHEEEVGLQEERPVGYPVNLQGFT